MSVWNWQQLKSFQNPAPCVLKANGHVLYSFLCVWICPSRPNEHTWHNRRWTVKLQPGKYMCVCSSISTMQSLTGIHSASNFTNHLGKKNTNTEGTQRRVELPWQPVNWQGQVRKGKGHHKEAVSPKTGFPYLSNRINVCVIQWSKETVTELLVLSKKVMFAIPVQQHEENICTVAFGEQFCIWNRSEVGKSLLQYLQN